MNKTELLALLQQFELRPGRGLGQNFLIDGNLLEFIVRSAEIAPGEQILEIGPGFGALTAALLKAGGAITAVEFDHRICDYLRGRWPLGGPRLIEADACRVDYAALFPPDGPEFRCVSNLPYSISSPFMAKMLDLPRPPVSILLLVQKEMAERLRAAPRSKDYGGLSVRVQAVYEVRMLRTVPPQVFHPRPEVDSAIVQLRRHAAIPALPRRQTLERLVKTGFSQRRKKTFNLLAREFEPERLAAAFAELVISMDIRADQISVNGYLELSRLMEAR